jgi:hypothetical protein
MKILRTALAVAAVAAAGIAAASASATPINPGVVPGLKLPIRPILPLCVPHIETKVQHLGPIWRTHFDRVTVIYVNRFCQKRVIRVYYKLHRGIFFRAAPKVS